MWRGSVSYIDSDLGLPGCHNLRLLTLLLLLGVWIALLCKRMQALRQMEQCAAPSAVDLPQMGAFITQLEQLTWNHFSQLWRMRLHPQCQLVTRSLAAHCSDYEAQGNGASFEVEASVDVAVSVYMRVSRSRLQQLVGGRPQRSGSAWRSLSRAASSAASAVGGTRVEMESRETRGPRLLAAEDCSRIYETSVPAGKQRVNVDNVPPDEDGQYSLVVALSPADRDPLLAQELTLCSGSQGIQRQLVGRSDLHGAWDIQGVFGFEYPDRECMVCFDEPRSVVFFPCRHCCVCDGCLRSLREEKCPLCRVMFYAHVSLPVKPTREA